MRSLPALTISIVILPLVFSLGCGDEGKETKKDSAAGESTAAPTKTGAITKIVPPPLPAPSLPAGHLGITVSYATPDDIAALVIHPRRLAAAPLAAEELAQEPAATTIRSLGLGPSDVEESVVLIGIGKSGKPAPAVAYLRFTREVEIEDVLDKVHALPKEKDTKPFVKETIDGKTCYGTGDPDGLVAYAPSKDVIVFATADDVHGVLAGNESKGLLYERLRGTDSAADVVFLAEADKYPDFAKLIDDNKAAAAQMQQYFDLAKTVREATISFDMTGGALLQVALVAKDAATAAKAENLLKDCKKTLAGAFAAFKQNQSKEIQDKYADAFKTGADAIDSIDVTLRGVVISAVMYRPAELDKAGAWIDALKNAASGK